MDGEGEGACRARQHLFGSLMFDGMGWNGRGECGEKPDTKLDTGEITREISSFVYLQ